MFFRSFLLYLTELLPKQLQKDDESKGTQIVRPDGRVVVIPPIERPATRSRNKKQDDPVPINISK